MPTTDLPSAFKNEERLVPTIPVAPLMATVLISLEEFTARDSLETTKMRAVIKTCAADVKLPVREAL